MALKTCSKWRIFRQETLGELAFITRVRLDYLKRFHLDLQISFSHVLKKCLLEIFSKMNLRPIYPCTVAFFKPRRQICDVSFGFLRGYKINSSHWDHIFSYIATFRKSSKSFINRDRQSNGDDRVRNNLILDHRKIFTKKCVQKLDYIKLPVTKIRMFYVNNLPQGRETSMVMCIMTDIFKDDIPGE